MALWHVDDLIQELDPLLPIYASIKRAIREKIERGELRSGDQVPSEQQFAETLRVSRSQARQALCELDQENFLVRCRGRGTFVGPPEARHPETRPMKSRVLQTAMSDPLYSYHGRSLSHGFCERAAENGYHTTHFVCGYDTIARVVDFLSEYNNTTSQGLALWPPEPCEEVCEMVRTVTRKRLPCVLFDSPLPGVEVDFVGTDNVDAYDRLTTRLVDMGHERVGYVTWNADLPNVRSRLAGYRRALERAGLPFEDELIIRTEAPADFSDPEALTRVLTSGDATAYVCWFPNIAWDLRTNVIALGLDPDEIDIATLDDLHGPETDIQSPFVRAWQDGYTIGRVACELLLGRIAHPERPAEHRLVRALFPEDLPKGLPR